MRYFFIILLFCFTASLLKAQTFVKADNDTTVMLTEGLSPCEVGDAADAHV